MTDEYVECGGDRSFGGVNNVQQNVRHNGPAKTHGAYSYTSDEPEYDLIRWACN